MNNTARQQGVMHQQAVETERKVMQARASLPLLFCITTCLAAKNVFCVYVCVGSSSKL